MDRECCAFSEENYYMQKLIAHLGGYFMDPCAFGADELMRLITPNVYTADNSELFKQAILDAVKTLSSPFDYTLQNTSIQASNLIIDVFREDISEIPTELKRTIFLAIRMYLDFGFAILIKQDKQWIVFNLGNSSLVRKNDELTIVRRYEKNKKSYTRPAFHIEDGKLLVFENEKKIELDEKKYILIGDGIASCGKRSVFSQMILNYYHYSLLYETRYLTKPPLNATDSDMLLAPDAINVNNDFSVSTPAYMSYQKPNAVGALEVAIKTQTEVIRANYDIQTLIQNPRGTEAVHVIGDFLDKFLKKNKQEKTIEVSPSMQEFAKYETLIRSLGGLFQLYPDARNMVNLHPILTQLLDRYGEADAILTPNQVYQRQQAEKAMLISQQKP